MANPQKDDKENLYQIIVGAIFEKFGLGGGIIFFIAVLGGLGLVLVKYDHEIQNFLQVLVAIGMAIGLLYFIASMIKDSDKAKK